MSRLMEAQLDKSIREFNEVEYKIDQDAHEWFAYHFNKNKRCFFTNNLMLQQKRT